MSLRMLLLFRGADQAPENRISKPRLTTPNGPTQMEMFMVLGSGLRKREWLSKALSCKRLDPSGRVIHVSCRPKILSQVPCEILRVHASVRGQHFGCQHDAGST